MTEEDKASRASRAACSRCPLEHGCGDAEVCRVMCMSDEEIVATTPNAEAVAAEMRGVIREALERHAAKARRLAGQR